MILIPEQNQAFIRKAVFESVAVPTVCLHVFLESIFSQSFLSFWESCFKMHNIVKLIFINFINKKHVVTPNLRNYCSEKILFVKKNHGTDELELGAYWKEYDFSMEPR